MTLQDIVFESLNNAVENDGEFLFSDPDYLAQDLQTYDADCENYDVEELLPHVKEWLRRRRN